MFSVDPLGAEGCGVGPLWIGFVCLVYLRNLGILDSLLAGLVALRSLPPGHSAICAALGFL